VTLVLTVEYAKVVYHDRVSLWFLFLILGGVWVFVSLRAARRNGSLRTKKA
jgi:hypothetical protein